MNLVRPRAAEFEEWPFETAYRPVLLATARLSPAIRACDEATAAFLVWSIVKQDPESGAMPPAAENPWHNRIAPGALPAAKAAALAHVAVRDNRLWLRLHQSFTAQPPAPSIALRVVELCRLMRTRTDAERTMIRAYARSWHARSRERLLDELTALPSLAEMCAYMVSYRPARMIRVPFGLAADVVLAAGALAQERSP